MKKRVWVVCAGFLGVLSTAAVAAQSTAIITNIDPNSKAITLSDGYTYALPASVDLSSLMLDEHVAVTYSEDASTGSRTATAVMVQG